MLKILGIPVPLPASLKFLANDVASLIASIGMAVVCALVIYPLLMRLFRHITRRTLTDVDDILLAISRTPFLVSVAVLVALNSFRHLHLPFAERRVAQLLGSILILTIAFWLHKLFTRVVIYHAKRFAEASETNVDDVLVPIATQLGPILIYMFAIAFALDSLGVSVSVIVTSIGGTVFVAGLALQPVLSNVFSGISLLADTPFRYGDLIVLQDGTICEVKKIGLRVTQLYSVKSHSVIYMPIAPWRTKRSSILRAPLRISLFRSQ
ncbi:MAG TPA: mechanosensitive ion channel family protein [Thermoanaerobaculia bacterium]|jgi:MscS family membrane protein|nr:mechanosensitive ion channel family protein [Thermoanaerobaculia bacterium]